MTISFCTACFNRLHQFERVFDENISRIREEKDVEWVILDPGSSDGLVTFVQARIQRIPCRVKFVKELSGMQWHASVAKNMAHRCADGQVLVNLDADNTIGDTIPLIRSLASQGVRAMHMWRGIVSDGTCGRIALAREVFHTLGGYDESFAPMGFQDHDLLARVSAYGVPVIRCSRHSGAAIPNSKDESVRYCRAPGLAWREYDRLNQALSGFNVAHGILVANRAGWRKMVVDVSHGGELV